MGMPTIDDVWEDLLQALDGQPFTFGLTPKKHARVTELLAEGKPWEEIGRDVGWEPNTLREFYERGNK